MIVSVTGSSISGRADAPPSKSFTHRAVVTAALAYGTSTIVNPLMSDDTDATIAVFKSIGVETERKGSEWKVFGGELTAPKADLFCNESGTTLRLATAVCSLVEGRCRITGAPSLLKRPIGELVGALKQLGAKCSCNGGFPPVVTENSFLGGTASLRGDVSSVFVSALLLIAPLGKKEVVINLSTRLESYPYVLMTLSSQKSFGVSVEASKDMRRFEIKSQKYRASSYKVEGDWSSAAFLLAAAALSGRVKVANLNIQSSQADRSIIDILNAMGAYVKTEGDTVTVEKSALKAINFDVSNCPDVFPALCVLCSAATGISRITGTERLKIKESDRITEMERGLTGMGIAFRRIGGAVEIKGGNAQGGIINSQDHRIAMAFGVLGTAAKGRTIIRNAECVSKSFPDFWECMKKLNAEIETV
ncbi:MAG: 3-phosphoshikimate 1-carboxyvinyltransferase [Candidatus Marsarchaeota archaeon]|nr:3-phosphoshikimate 1-carboxyvinyltransferase [Candidatus Marsarchaeota archaeon]